MTEEVKPITVWKGKGPIVYSFKIDAPERAAGTPPWHSDRIDDAWKYRLSVTGASKEYETSVPELSLLADTKQGMIRDIAGYITLLMTDKQSANLPKISPDNIEVIDNTNGSFNGINVPSIFTVAKQLADASPPPGEPIYLIEITKNVGEPDDKQYNVSILYANHYVDPMSVAEKEQALQEGVDKFSRIPAQLVPAAIARYLLSRTLHNDILPTPTNMKIINFTDNPGFNVQQVLAAVKALIPAQQAQQARSVQLQEPRTQPSRYAEGRMVPPPRPTGQAHITPAAVEKEAKAEAKQEESAVETLAGKKKWFSFFEPKNGFDSVIGMDYAKKFLKDNVILGLKRPDLFAKYKKSIHDGFLFFGPPGVGKTYLAGALAKEANMKLLVVSIHQLLDQYLGNTEKNIHKVFEQARENAPCIILLDEIDGLGVSRNVSREAGAASQALALNQLLTEMDGLENDNENVIVIGTTNAPQDIDTALLRSGRFTNMLYMRPPDKEDRTKLFEFYTEDIPKDELDYEKLGNESNNLSPADIHAVVKAAVTPLIAEAAETDELKDLTTDGLLKAIRSRRASGSTMIKWYEDMDKILKRGGFSEEEKLLYGDLLNDIKQRVKSPRKKRRRSRKSSLEVAEPVRERLRA